VFYILEPVNFYAVFSSLALLILKLGFKILIVILKAAVM